MWTMLWPLLVVILSNVGYHISQKSVPAQTNAFASLTVTYLIATLLSVLLFLVSAKPQNMASELGKVNWSAVALGFVLVAVEAGWIFMYRNGWKVSVASLTANIVLACVLLLLGVLLYRDSLTLVQLGGMLLCVLGLFLIRQ